MIPAHWPDVDALLLSYLRPRNAGVTVANEKPSKIAAGDLILFQVVPGRETTPISREYRILLETWSYRAGSLAADVGRSFRLMDNVMYQLKSLPLQSLAISVDLNAGPNKARDKESGFVYHEGTIVSTFSPTSF